MADDSYRAMILGRDEPDDLLKAETAQIDTEDVGEVEKCAVPPYNLSHLADLYETNSTHKACVDAKAAAEVGYGWKLAWVGEGDGPDDPEQDPEWQMLDALLEQTNDRGMSFTEVMRSVVVDIESTGNGYVELTRNPRREIDGLFHVGSSFINVLKDRTGFRQRYSAKSTWYRNACDLEGEGPTAEAKTELIHFLKYTPKNTYYGIPDVIPAITAMAGDKSAREYNVNFFEHNTVPRMALIVEGGDEPGKDFVEMVQRYLQAEVKGKGHKTLVLWAKKPAGEGDAPKVRLEPLGVGKTEDASFLNYRMANRDEVLMVHRVPPSKITIVENANLANSRDQDKTFHEEVVRPAQHYLQSMLNHFLVHHENGLNVQNWEIRFNEADLTSDREDAEVAKLMFDAGMLDQNQFLQEHGKAPIEGLEEPLVPKSAVPLSQVGAEPAGQQPPQFALSDDQVRDLAKTLLAEGAEPWAFDEDEERGWAE